MVVYVCVVCVSVSVSVSVCVRRGVVGSVVYGWCCWFGTVRCGVVGSVQVPGIIVLSYLSLARYRDKYK